MGKILTIVRYRPKKWVESLLIRLFSLILLKSNAGGDLFVLILALAHAHRANVGRNTTL
ncbi:hypothetical protein SAMN06265222_101706 [Neorhodopirellula lusitana]|uniref:Uncharacterized protein n=1 Tax=Neorhodopirellula lusitana TaxID=445327 RepID=A0ABY1PQP9_9BACT|nr:hypothetical protein SAMN06265222_101706 [Neorhodopirellula lusitana]